MRKYLVREMLAAGYKVTEAPVTISALEAADEVFLTNAIHGIKWVRRFGNTIYNNRYSSEIYSRIIQTIPR